MALGNKGQNQNLKLYILKVKTKDTDGKPVAPFFQISEKIDEKWTPSENGVSSVSGTIYKIETRVGEYQGEPILSAQVFLKDGEEAYLLDLKYTMLTRSILNSILNITDFSKEVEISLYTNKKGYASASVRAGGKLVDWKYSIAELPAPEKIKFKGKEMRDFTAVDNFFQDKVKEFGQGLSEGAGTVANSGGSAGDAGIVEDDVVGGSVDAVEDDAESLF